jgi:hypothetical protein
MTRRLRIHFDRAEDFRLELERNIAKGGIFVPGANGLELRELLELEISLEFLGERHSLEAEVVHIAPGVGVALQFRRPAADLRQEFSALLYRVASDDAWSLPEDAIPLAPPDAPAQEAPATAEETPPIERRRARRAPARVPALLDGDNARIQGMTRNLSKTGALISADASELPPGKPVRLKLRHPDTGDPVELNARVTRHIRTEGTVAAVSVDFQEGAEQKQDLAELVRAAETAHERRGATGISGRIEELGMPNLVQMLGRSSPHGTLSARSGAEEGVLAFEGGNIRYVRLGATRGIKALGRILQWTQGTFEFHAHVDTLDVEDEPMRLEAALLEATRRIDESVRAGATRLDPKLRFGVDRDALASAGELAKVEAAVLDLASAGFTVRRILDVIPEDDAQVSEALLALIERGVLTPA